MRERVHLLFILKQPVHKIERKKHKIEREIYIFDRMNKKNNRIFAIKIKRNQNRKKKRKE